MSIQVSCPNCQASYALADTLRGKKVRCKSCQGVISVEETSADVPMLEVAEVESVTATPPAPPLLRPSSPPALHSGSTPPTLPPFKPVGKKVQAKSGGSKGLLIGAGLGLVAGLLVVVGGAAGAYFLWIKSPVASLAASIDADVKKAADNFPKEIDIGKKDPGDGGKKGGKASSKLDEALANLKDNGKRVQALHWFADKQNLAQARRSEVFRAIDQAFLTGASQDFVDPLLIWSGPGDSAKLVAYATQDEDTNRRDVALEVLGKKKDPAAAAAFAKQLINSKVRDDNVGRLRDLGPVAAPAVARYAFHSDEDVQTAANKLLIDWKVKEDVWVDAALVALKDPSKDIQRAAITNLGRFREAYAPRRSAVAKAVDAHLNDADKSIRESALRTLKLWATKDNTATLVALLKLATDNRDDYIFALGETSDPAAAEYLAFLITTKDRVAASRALKKIGPASQNFVLPLMNDKDADTRGEAQRLLAVLNTKQESLAQQAAKDLSNNDRRDAALQWLRDNPAIDGLKSQVAQAIMPLTKDPNASLAQMAQATLIRWGGPPAVTPDPPIRPQPNPKPLPDGKILIVANPKTMDAAALDAIKSGKLSEASVTAVESDKKKELQITQTKAEVPGFQIGAWTPITLTAGEVKFTAYTNAKEIQAGSKLKGLTFKANAQSDIAIGFNVDSVALHVMEAGFQASSPIAVTPGATRVYFMMQSGIDKEDLENIKKNKFLELEITAPYMKKGVPQIAQVITISMENVPDLVPDRYAGWVLKTNKGASPATGVLRMYTPLKEGVVGQGVKLTELVLKGEAKARYKLDIGDFKDTVYVVEATVTGDVAKAPEQPKVDPFPKIDPKIDPNPKVNPNDGMQAILDELKSPDATKRHKALQDLAQTGNPAAAGAIVNYINMHPTDHNAAGNALKQLAQTGGPPARQAVQQAAMSLLNSPNNNIQIEARQVLQALGVPIPNPNPKKKGGKF